MAGFNLNSLLNTKTKTAAEQETDSTQAAVVTDTEQGFEVVMIDVEDLMPSKDNFYSTENIEDLAVTIELSGGIEQNLVVKPEAHGKYELIAGHRRRLAALKLLSEGKEEYRKVPCRIKKESDTVKDKLSLIFTNSSARQLNDWEKVQQAQQLKEALTEYKKVLDNEIKEAIKAGDYCGGCQYSCKGADGETDGCECEALEEEDKDTYLAVKGEGCPCYERARMGRIRDIVAQTLNTSTTQIGRMEAISKNLSTEFKEEFEKGNINISTAHELSKLDNDKQTQAYQQYEEKGELHIKDVKEEPKEEITDEQTEQVQLAIEDAIKGEVNRAVFKAKGNTEGIEKALRKHFEKTFKGSKINLEDGTHFIYRFSAEGITVINEEWKNYLIEWKDLAEIVALMIESDILQYDDTQEEIQEEENGDIDYSEESEDTFKGMNKPTAAEEDNEELPGQQDISDYPDYVPDPNEKGLSFQKWLAEKYGIGQYNMIKKEVRSVIMAESENGNHCPKEWEDKITNALSVWLNGKSTEYQKYLES